MSDIVQLDVNMKTCKRNSVCSSLSDNNQSGYESETCSDNNQAGYETETCSDNNQVGSETETCPDNNQVGYETKTCFDNNQSGYETESCSDNNQASYETETCSDNNQAGYEVSESEEGWPSLPVSVSSRLSESIQMFVESHHNINQLDGAKIAVVAVMSLTGMRKHILPR